MRYRTGPIAGTLILAVVAVLGIVGEITAGVGGQSSVGSAIFGLVVIIVFAGLAASGLNELRGVRTERQSDGTAVVKLPGLVPRWKTTDAAEIETIFLVLVGSKRSRLYNLAITLRDGTNMKSGAVAVRRPVRVELADTTAARMIEQISRDIGIGRGRARG